MERVSHECSVPRWYALLCNDWYIDSVDSHQLLKIICFSFSGVLFSGFTDKFLSWRRIILFVLWLSQPRYSVFLVSSVLYVLLVVMLFRTLRKSTTRWNRSLMKHWRWPSILRWVLLLPRVQGPQVPPDVAKTRCVFCSNHFVFWKARRNARASDRSEYLAQWIKNVLTESNEEWLPQRELLLVNADVYFENIHERTKTGLIPDDSPPKKW